MYSSQAVCKIMGITLRQLRHWIEAEIINPLAVEKSGNQNKYNFDFRNLLEICLVLELKNRSLSLTQIKKAVETFNRDLIPHEITSNLTLFSDGESYYALSCNPRDSFDILRKGKTLFAVPVDELALKLAEQIDLEVEEIAQNISREKLEKNYVLIKFKF